MQTMTNPGLCVTIVGGVAQVQLTKMSERLMLFLITIICATTVCESYKTELKGLKQCDNPEPPYRSPNPVNVTMEMYKGHRKTLLRGNITVLEDTVNYLKFVGNVYVDGKKKQTMKMEKATCKSVLTKVIYAASRVAYDADSCKVLKGSYSFDNVDVQKEDTANYMSPGRLLGLNEWRIQLFGDAGTHICFTIQVKYRV